MNREDHKLVEEALTAVGISHKAANYVAELSDGERQKVMIAKALVQECPLILLDEPTAFLDVVSRIEIMTLLHTIAREQHKPILLSTHDIDQALIQADRLWLLAPGKGLQCALRRIWSLTMDWTVCSITGKYVLTGDVGAISPSYRIIRKSSSGRTIPAFGIGVSML